MGYLLFKILASSTQASKFYNKQVLYAIASCIGTPLKIFHLASKFDENFLALQNICMKIFQHILIWVEEQTYWIACRFLMLGFELELYSASEYCMVYWYLYAVLVKLAEKTHLKMAVSHDTGNCSFTLPLL